MENTDRWQIFKTELKEYWKTSKLPKLSFLKLEEGMSIQKLYALLGILTLVLGFVSMFLFAFFLLSEGIPYSSVSWNIHIISFFAFFFSLVFCIVMMIPLFLYANASLNTYNFNFMKDAPWSLSNWIFSFGTAFIVYFSILGIEFWYDKKNQYISYLSFILICIFVFLICYFMSLCGIGLPPSPLGEHFSILV